MGERLTGHPDEVTPVAYSPDGRFITSRSWDGEIRIWDTKSGVAIRVMEGCKGLGLLAYSRDVTKVACCGQGGIVIRDAQSGELLKKLSDMGDICDVASSQDGRFLASGSGDQVVRVWDAETLGVVAEYEEHGGFLYSVFSSDGNTLLSASFEGKMVLWDVPSRQTSSVIVQEPNISSAVGSSVGRLYTTCSEDGGVRVWSADFHFNTVSSSICNRLRQVARSPGAARLYLLQPMEKLTSIPSALGDYNVY